MCLFLVLFNYLTDIVLDISFVLFVGCSQRLQDEMQPLIGFDHHTWTLSQRANLDSFAAIEPRSARPVIGSGTQSRGGHMAATGNNDYY